ncbi:MAG: hypothetical protein HQM08_30530 [Candidatus Riflebacteria bacterium]|nr:hypothetical protein [Candidatus Riflebacteria bacterium]
MKRRKILSTVLILFAMGGALWAQTDTSTTTDQSGAQTDTSTVCIQPPTPPDPAMTPGQPGSKFQALKAIFDSNSNGQITLDAWTQAGLPKELFQRFDVNKDTLLDSTEIYNARTQLQKREQEGFKGGFKGSGPQGFPQWNTLTSDPRAGNKHPPFDGKNGYENASGTPNWRNGHPPFPGGRPPWAFGNASGTPDGRPPFFGGRPPWTFNGSGTPDWNPGNASFPDGKFPKFGQRWGFGHASGTPDWNPGNASFPDGKFPKFGQRWGFGHASGTPDWNPGNASFPDGKFPGHGHHWGYGKPTDGSDVNQGDPTQQTPPDQQPGFWTRLKNSISNFFSNL